MRLLARKPIKYSSSKSVISIVYVFIFGYSSAYFLIPLLIPPYEEHWLIHVEFLFVEINKCPATQLLELIYPLKWT